MPTFIPPDGLHVVRRDKPGELRSFKLLRDHLVATETVRVLLPQGFEFDGASVPNCLRWLVAALDPWGRYEYPAAAHDLLYLTQRTSREEADLTFRILMEARGVPYLARMVIYAAVRLFGQKAWDKSKGCPRWLLRDGKVDTKLAEQRWADANGEAVV